MNNNKAVRADDRNRLSLRCVNVSLRHCATVSWITSNIGFYVMRLLTSSLCSSECRIVATERRSAVRDSLQMRYANCFLAGNGLCRARCLLAGHWCKK